MCAFWCSLSSHCGSSVSDAQWLHTPHWAVCGGEVCQRWTWSEEYRTMAHREQHLFSQPAIFLHLETDHSPSISPYVQQSVHLVLLRILDRHLWLPIHGCFYCSANSKIFHWENRSILKCSLANLDLYMPHLRLLGVEKMYSKKIIWIL